MRQSLCWVRSAVWLTCRKAMKPTRSAASAVLSLPSSAAIPKPVRLPKSSCAAWSARTSWSAATAATHRGVRSGSAENLTDLRRQLPDRKRLLEKRHIEFENALAASLRPGVAAHEKSLHTGPQLAHPAHELRPALLRHDDIRKQEVDRAIVSGSHLQRFLTRRSIHNVIPLSFE